MSNPSYDHLQQITWVYNFQISQIFFKFEIKYNLIWYDNDHEKESEVVTEIIWAFGQSFSIIITQRVAWSIFFIQAQNLHKNLHLHDTFDLLLKILKIF